MENKKRKYNFVEEKHARLLNGDDIMRKASVAANDAVAKGLPKGFIDKNPKPGTKISFTYTFKRAGWEQSEVQTWIDD